MVLPDFVPDEELDDEIPEKEVEAEPEHIEIPEEGDDGSV